MKKLTCRSWGVSNRYKVQKLNQLIRGWINYFKIGRMKGLCERLDSNIRYRLRMCIWKHWKTPQNRAKNLMKLDVPRWAAYKIAYCGNRYARLAHNGWVHKAISNERLAAFGLVSMSNYYAERRVLCEVDWTAACGTAWAGVWEVGNSSIRGISSYSIAYGAEPMELYMGNGPCFHSGLN